MCAHERPGQGARARPDRRAGGRVRRPRDVLAGVVGGARARRPVLLDALLVHARPGVPARHEPLPRGDARDPRRVARRGVLRRRRQQARRRRPLAARHLHAARGDERGPVQQPSLAREHGARRRPGDDRAAAHAPRRRLGRARPVPRARQPDVRRRGARLDRGRRAAPRRGRAHGRCSSARRRDPEGPDSPGLVVLTQDWEVESATPGVERWVSELPDGDWDAGTLPPSVLAVAGRARRTAEGRGGSGRGRRRPRAVALGHLGGPPRRLPRRRRDPRASR